MLSNFPFFPGNASSAHNHQQQLVCLKIDSGLVFSEQNFCSEEKCFALIDNLTMNSNHSVDPPLN